MQESRRAQIQNCDPRDRQRRSGEEGLCSAEGHMTSRCFDVCGLDMYAIPIRPRCETVQ